MTKKIIIYGAGKSGKLAHPFLSSKYRIIAFADKNFEKFPEGYLGHPVISPNAILKMSFDKIFIASQERFEITTELNKLGIPYKKISGVPPEILLGDYETNFEDEINQLQLRALAHQAVSQFYHYPILVNGPSRGGTSVLVQGIGHHPLVLGAPKETNFFPFISKIISDIEFSPQGNMPKTTLQESPLFIHRELGKLMFHCAFGDNYGYKSWNTHPLWQEKHQLPFRAWTAKPTLSDEIFKEIEYIFPLVKGILIVRNGIDNVNSLYNWNRSAPGIDFQYWTQYWTHTIQRLLTLRDHPNCLLVKHEELIENDTGFWEKILDFLELPFANEVVQFSRETLVKSSFPDPEFSGVPKNKIFNKREKPYINWTQEMKDIFIKNCQETMELLGYEIPF